MRFLTAALLAALASASLGVTPSSAVDDPFARPGSAPAPVGGGANPPFGSTRYFYPACKGILDDKNSEDLFRQGQCSGELLAMSSVSEQLSNSLRFCSPATVTAGELSRTFLSYVDARPDQMDKPFIDVALAALRAKWPCR